MKKILILGGTRFIGIHLIDALSRNKCYEITILNRGITNRNIVQKVKRIYCDRNSNNLQIISNSNWDYVIDLSCYSPLILNKTLHYLNKNKEKIKRYIFLSTVAVYQENSVISKSEKEAIKFYNIAQETEKSFKYYGNKKAECERILKSFGFKYIILRPAITYGPFDYTNRLYYWIDMIRKQNSIHLPNLGKNLFSCTYVKDLVEAILFVLEDEIENEIYNVISNEKLTLFKLVTAISDCFKKKIQINNIDHITLIENYLKEWVDIPLYKSNNFNTFSAKKMNAKLIYRNSFEDSLQETIRYFEDRNWPKVNTNFYKLN